jgi:hypothetical protein
MLVIIRVIVIVDNNNIVDDGSGRLGLAEDMHTC